MPGDLWEVHSVTGSPIQGVLSEVPGWPLRAPLRAPLRDPRTSQNRSGLLPLFLLPLDGPHRQSPVFREHGQLSHAIPQFHVERMLHQRKRPSRFESRNECRVKEGVIPVFWREIWPPTHACDLNRSDITRYPRDPPVLKTLRPTDSELRYREKIQYGRSKTLQRGLRNAGCSREKRQANILVTLFLLEEDKRATTDVQNGLVFLFVFSYKKSFTFKRSPGEIILKMCGKVRKSVTMCEQAPKRFCPLVVAPSTLIFFSLLFWKKQGKPPKKARTFSLLRTPKIPGKEGKNAQKSKEVPCNEKSKEIQKPRGR